MICSNTDRDLLSDPLLHSFPPSERRAILVHKYFLGIENGSDPGLAHAVASWERKHARAWRETKMESDFQAQLCEIEKHRHYLSEGAGHDVGWEFALRDWMREHAHGWREWWEQQRESGA